MWGQCNERPKSERFDNRTIIEHPKSESVRISNVDCIVIYSVCITTMYISTIKYSECLKSQRSVWETEQKMLWFSARSDFRRFGQFGLFGLKG